MPRARSPLPHLAGNLRRLREAAGLSQPELAEAADTSIETVSRIERGTLAPSADLLIRLAAALDVHAEDLVGVRRASAPKHRPALRRLVRAAERLDDEQLDALARAVTLLVKRR